MSEADPFIDYYAVLQVDPGCDDKMLQKAYRHLAHQYHPDHAETADPERLAEIVDAYRVLKDAERRAKYDEVHQLHVEDMRTAPDPFDLDEATALADAEAHEEILHYLYKRRREYPGEPGVVGFYIRQHLGCSDENFEFHIWFLKSKNLLTTNEESQLEITIEGVEHVISRSRSKRVEKLLMAPESDDE